MHWRSTTPQRPWGSSRRPLRPGGTRWSCSAAAGSSWRTSSARGWTSCSTSPRGEATTAAARPRCPRSWRCSPSPTPAQTHSVSPCAWTSRSPKCWPSRQGCAPPGGACSKTGTGSRHWTAAAFPSLPSSSRRTKAQARGCASRQWWKTPGRRSRPSRACSKDIGSR